MKRSPQFYLFGSAIVLSASLFVAGCNSSSTAEAAPEISGTLAPRSRVAVKPKLPGAIDRVFVDIGDAVAMGQTIATIDRREIDAQVDASVAAVAVAKAALETSEAHLASVAQRDLATANLAQANAALRRSKDVQSNSTVTSPVTGFVVERNYDSGAMPGDKPIVVVADLREMKLEAGVSEFEAGRLKVGMKAAVVVQAK